MLKINKLKILSVAALLALALALPCRSQASDLDIFGTFKEQLQPNILIILDLSGSMNYNINNPNSNASPTRLEIAKETLVRIIENNKKVKWGLMTFRGSAPGKIIEPCKSRNEAEDLDDIIDAINGASATGGTPLATSLAEAGLYFAGQRSFYYYSKTSTGTNSNNSARYTSSNSSDFYDVNADKYKTPINLICQNNYIILVTDGAPSVDSGNRQTTASPSYGNTSFTSWTATNISNNIFLQNSYINDVENRPRPIRNYITRMTDMHNADPTTGLDLGYLISHESTDPEEENFVFYESLVVGENPNIPHGVVSVNNSTTFWQNDWVSGSSYSFPASASASNVFPSYTTAQWEAFTKANPPEYKWGYNAANPSIPIPQPLFAYSSYTSGSGNNRKTYYYSKFDTANYGYRVLGSSTPTTGTGVVPNDRFIQVAYGNMYGAGSYSSDYLDDVAAFLYNEDLIPDYGIGRYEKQNVKTFVIGLQINIDLLQRTAVQGGTGWDGYMYVDKQDELEKSMDLVMEYIINDMTAFALPAVPTAVDNEIYAGNKIYMPFFRPASEYSWSGNLKRLTLDENNSAAYLMDEDTGEIHADTTTDWSEIYGVIKDGDDISQGGAAAALFWQYNNEFTIDSAGNEADTALTTTAGLRRVYTYLGATTDLTAGSNAFRTKNARLTDAVMDITPISNRTKDPTIKFIRQYKKGDFGAVIHSSPAVVHYAGKADAYRSNGVFRNSAYCTPTDTVVFVGANDGMLHAIDDSDGRELWTFIMPEHLPELQYIQDESATDGRYYVDASIATTTIDGKSIVLFGARRGGHTYVGLDVSSYTAPKFAYQINGGNPNPWSAYNLGESWGLAQFSKIHNTAVGITAEDGGMVWTDNANCLSMQQDVDYNDAANESDRWVAVLPGGYDPEYQKHQSVGVEDPKGAAVIGFNPVTGEEHDAFTLLNSANSPIMKHSVLDVTVLDVNNDQRLDTIYFGDMGGNLFYAIPYKATFNTNDRCTGDALRLEFKAVTEFHPYLLYKELGTLSTNLSDQRKVMYAPDIILEQDGHYVYFGTGDRETPMDGDVVNRFYCIKNKNVANGGLIHLENDSNGLSALTAKTDGNPTGEIIKAYTMPEDLTTFDETIIQINQLAAAKGWYIELRKAEKIVSSPIVYNGAVYFTTYIPEPEEPEEGSGNTPPSEEEEEDLCKSGFTGTAYLYALDYMTAGAALALDPNNPDNKVIGTEIGGTIPTSPVVAMFEQGIKMFIGVGLGLYETDLNASGSSGTFYWSEIF